MEATNSGIKRVEIEAIRIVRETDTDGDVSYLEQEEFSDRLAEYQAGTFGFMGIYAEATLKVPTVQGGWIHTGKVSSPGLWGIEDDSEEAYLEDVEREQLYELRDILRDGYGFSDDAISEAFETVGD